VALVLALEGALLPGRARKPPSTLAEGENSHSCGTAHRAHKRLLLTQYDEHLHKDVLFWLCMAAAKLYH
jgi:hypothetical protein